MFGQTFDPHDLIVIGLLVVLEGVLSIDNALVLGLLARRLPKRMQGKALTYGLVGAFVFRIVAIATATWLLRWRWVKLLGGLYLLYVSVKHFFFEGDIREREEVTIGPDGTPVVKDDDVPREAHAVQTGVGGYAAFWSTVAVIELTDIAFAVDSILAAIALVGPPAPPFDPEKTHPKLWVVVTGGMLGVILMRFAAVLFIKLLERFPRFETSAYLLVILIGLKLIADWWFNTDPQHPNPNFNFHSPSSIGFWVFWVSMVACFCVGFIPARQGKYHVRLAAPPPEVPEPQELPAARSHL